MRWGWFLFVLALGACSTKYQDMGLAGGVSAQQMTADSFRIVARGNGYTGHTQIEDYTMLKAAETAKANGATHFVLISAADASSVGQFVTPGNATTTVSGRTAYTTYSPSQVQSVYRPGQNTYIRLVNVMPGTQPPAGAILADEIIRFVGSRVNRG
jgi:hypothetical protein